MEFPSTSIDLTIFISCYNEEKTILPTLGNLSSLMESFPYTWEAIVIDDASKDGSVENVQSFRNDYPELPIRLVKNVENSGLAYNYVTAAFLGKGRYFRMMCGDNPEPPETTIKILNHLGKADLVLPYHTQFEGRTAARKWISKAYTFLVNRMTGHHLHYYNGSPLLLREHVLRWHSYSRGFGFQADMVSRMLDMDFSYVQVPIRGVETREAGTSNALTFRNFVSVGSTFLELFLRRLSRKLYNIPKERPQEVPLRPEGSKKGVFPE